MKRKLHPIKTDAEVEFAWVCALSDEQTNVPVHVTPSRNELENYGNDAEVMMDIARSEIKCSISEEADSIFTDRTQAESQTQIKNTLANMLQFGHSAFLNGIKTASALLLDTTVVAVFRRMTADEVIAEYFQRWENLNEYMNAIGKQIVPNLFYTPPGAGLMTKYVNATIEKFCFDASLRLNWIS